MSVRLSSKSLPAIPLMKDETQADNLPNDQCQICHLKGKRKNSYFYCMPCGMPLCKSCHDQHKSTEVTQDHQVVPKKQKELHPKLCPVHRFANIQYYCDTCMEMICVNCTMIEHRGHSITNLDKKYNQCQNMIKSTHDELDRKIISVVTEVRKVSDLRSGIEATREEVKVDINAKVVALQQKIKLQQEQLLRSLDHYLDSKLDFLVKKQEILQRRHEEMVALRKSSEREYAELPEEKFIHHVMRMQKEVQTLKFEPGMNDNEYMMPHFVMTNNEELGKLEQTRESIVQSKTKGRSGQKLRGSANEVNGKTTLKALHMHSPMQSETRMFQKRPNLEPLDAKDWRKVRIVHRFKTSTFIEKLTGLALLPNGKLLIADGTKHGITLCDQSGKFQQKILTEELPYPAGLVIDKNGHIVVSTERFIKSFKVGGNKIGQITVPPAPCALCLDHHDHLFINDPKARCVTMYDEEGKECGKFSTDKNNNGPDPHTMAVGDKTVALSYTSYGVSACVRTFSYSGQLMSTFKLPDACHGLLVDRTGNLILAAGELCFASGLGSQSVAGFTCVDRSGKSFKLVPHGLISTPNGQICTVHMNPLAKRSEVIFLQLGS